MPLLLVWLTATEELREMEEYELVTSYIVVFCVSFFIGIF